MTRLIFSMVDVILNRVTYFSKKNAYTYFRGLKLIYTYINSKNTLKIAMVKVILNPVTYFSPKLHTLVFEV